MQERLRIRAERRCHELEGRLRSLQRSYRELEQGARVAASR